MSARMAGRPRVSSAQGGLAQTPKMASRGSSNAGTSSILKTPSLRSAEIRRLTNSHQVTFQPPAYIVDILQEYHEGKCGRYNQLISFFWEMKIPDELLSHWLVELKPNLHLLDRSVEEFIQAFLKLQWAHRPNSLKNLFKDFILSLITAHNYYVKAVLRFILTSFAPDIKDDDTSITPGKPSEEEVVVFTYSHEILQTALLLVPMMQKLLDTSLSDCFPYIMKPTHQQACYIINLLHIASYVPHKKQFVLSLILSRLIKMDASVLREDLEDMEEEMDEDMEEEIEEGMDVLNSATNDVGCTTAVISELDFVRPGFLKARPIGHTMADKLDVLLVVLVEYIYHDCHHESEEIDWEATRKLYKEIWEGVETNIMSNHALSHVQFVMLYMCSFKSTLCESFLVSLWKKVCTVSMPNVLRQNAATYLGGFLARAKFIDMSTVQIYMDRMARWAHNYARNCDRDTADRMHHHGVFHSVCQSLLYLVVFFENYIMEDKKGLPFLQSLELNKLVTSHLNPLAVCTDGVLDSFIRVVHTYQLAYCFSVLENNRRNWLPRLTVMGKPGEDYKLKPYFPFDPCLLPRLSVIIAPLYRQYREGRSLGCPIAIEPGGARRDREEDDYIDNARMAGLGSADLIALGTSPPVLFQKPGK